MANTHAAASINAFSAERWSRASTLVLVGGAAATLIAVILVALVTGNAFRRAIAEEQSHSILLARVIEDQATRTLDSGEMALDALAISPALRADVPDAAAIQAALNQTLSGLPFLRTIAVADAHGNILASTSPSEAGIRIDLERLGPRNVGGRAVLGPLVMGRDWLRSRWAPLR